MVDIPDSTLMAYADGELASDTRKAVEAVLAVDPVARERLAAFTSTRREGLAPLFDPLIGEPVPEQLRDLVLGFSMGLNGVQAMPSPSPLARARDLLALVQSLLAPPAMAWAKVGLVLLVGMGVGWAISRATVGTDSAETQAGLLRGVGVATGPLKLALEATPSGTPVSLQVDGAGTGVSFEAKLSFVSEDRRYCRQYKTSDLSGSHYAGLACRSEDGVWQIEVYARASSTTESSNKEFVPAQGDSGPVAAAVLDMISGVALAKEQEMELIRDGWRTGP